MLETVGLSLKDLKLSGSNDDVLVALKPNAEEVVKELLNKKSSIHLVSTMTMLFACLESAHLVIRSLSCME